MKKTVLMFIVSTLTISANADTWNYKLLKDDFDGDTKSASIQSDHSEVELAIIKNKISDDRNYTIAFLLPRGILTSSKCKLCTTRVIADGKEVESIKLLEASNFRTYFLYSDSESFIDLFQKNKVIKIQLPTYSGNKNLTFTQSTPFNIKKLDIAN